MNFSQAFAEMSFAGQLVAMFVMLTGILYFFGPEFKWFKTRFGFKKDDS